MADGVAAKDLYPLDVNRAFLADTGYERVEVIGRTSQAIGLFADPPIGAQIVKGLREHGRVRELDTLTAERDRLAAQQGSERQPDHEARERWPIAPDDGELASRQADITFRLARIAKQLGWRLEYS